jgi:hypothetical protein
LLKNGKKQIFIYIYLGPDLVMPQPRPQELLLVLEEVQKRRFLAPLTRLAPSVIISYNEQAVISSFYNCNIRKIDSFLL